MLRLYPLLRAKTRLDRLMRVSTVVHGLGQRHALLAASLLPAAFALRYLCRREIQQLEQQGYPIRQRAFY